MAFFHKSSFKPQFKFIPKSKSIISLNSQIPGIPPRVLACRETGQFYIYEYSMKQGEVNYPTMICTLHESSFGEKYAYIETSEGHNIERINNLQQFIYEKFHVNSFYIKFMEDSHNKFSYVERPCSSLYILKRKEKSENQRKKIVEKRRSKVSESMITSKRTLPWKLEIKDSYTSVIL